MLSRRMSGEGGSGDFLFARAIGAWRLDVVLESVVVGSAGVGGREGTSDAWEEAGGVKGERKSNGFRSV